VKPTRLYQLDALRGIAAMMVVFYHYIYLYDKQYGHSFDVPGWINLGQTGVHLFFIISGFVIFWTLRRANRPMDFVFSRFSRLYPAFWAALLITFTFTSLIGPLDRAVSWEAFAANLTMFQGFLGYRHIDGVYWTLTIELAFYILAFTVLLSGLLVFADYICLFWLATSFGQALSGADFGILEQALLLKYNLFFVTGISFYRIWSKEARKVPIVCVILSILLAYFRFPIEIAIVISIWIGTFSLVIAGRLHWLSQKSLIWLGSVSYSLYLIHQNIGYGIINLGYQLELHPAISISLALLISFAVAQGITKFVERPALSCLRAWYYQRCTPNIPSPEQKF
jgi:peptidoglycan/LPS O-acetylase OafA/YrhL